MLLDTHLFFTNFSCALLLGALSGCASMPDLGPQPTPRADLITYEEQESYNFICPQEWWKLYHDPQLSELIAEGLSQSPSMAEAAARIQKAHALALLTGASLAPSLTADGTVGKGRQSYNQGLSPALVPHGFINTGRAAVNFDYELDFFGKNSDSLAAAISELEAAKLRAMQTEIILSTSIAAAYAKLAQLYAELDVANESVSVRAQTVALFKERYKNGLENEGGLEQANSNQAMAEAEVAALEETLALTANSLAALIGAKPTRTLKIKRPNLAEITSFGAPTVIPADLIGRRPDIIAAQLSLEAAASRINVAKAGFYPNINLTGYLGHQSLGLDTFMKSSSLIGSFGPAIHLPIFDGGRIASQYRGARADYDTSLSCYETAIIQALHEVADAITSHKALELRRQKTTAAVQAAGRAYHIANTRYRGGLSTYLEVLHAEDNLISSRRAMADIRARAFTLDVALVKALGGGFKPTTKGGGTVS